MANLVIRSVCERDLDLFLLQELHASPRFLKWFLTAIGLTTNMKLQEIARSVTNSIGESDLELTVCDKRGRMKVMVENKIDAALQLDQAGRYRERAKSYQQQNLCDSVLTVIIAPEKYLKDHSKREGFDRHVTYENVLAWLEENDSQNPYHPYRAEILLRAIDRSREGWVFRPNEAATAFWAAYWDLANKLAPRLCMPRPSTMPPRSDVVWFYPPELETRKDIWLRHNLLGGSVHLLFKAWTAVSVQERFGASLRPGMQVVKAGRSARIQIEVPPIQQREAFTLAEAVVRNALKAGEQLLEFYLAVVR